MICLGGRQLAVSFRPTPTSPYGLTNGPVATNLEHCLYTMFLLRRKRERESTAKFHGCNWAMLGPFFELPASVTIQSVVGKIDLTCGPLATWGFSFF